MSEGPRACTGRGAVELPGGERAENGVREMEMGGEVGEEVKGDRATDRDGARGRAARGSVCMDMVSLVQTLGEGSLGSDGSL